VGVLSLEWVGSHFVRLAMWYKAAKKPTHVFVPSPPAHTRHRSPDNPWFFSLEVTVTVMLVLEILLRLAVLRMVGVAKPAIHFPLLYSLPLCGPGSGLRTQRPG
jgi:hypothetical protein